MTDSYKIDNLTPAEEAWLDQQRAAAKVFATRYNADPAGETPTLHELEAAYECWLSRSASRLRRFRQTDVNAVVNALGVSLGDWLVEHTEMRWRIITDAWGTDLGLYMPGTGVYSDVITHPTNFVAKRVADRLSGWFVRLSEPLLADLIWMQGAQEGDERIPQDE